MPDKRSHRGRHPADTHFFAEGSLPALRQAVSDLSWLLSAGYAEDSSLKLVGDRHGLTQRQRMAVRRASCSNAAAALRSSKRMSREACAGRRLGIDGYNQLITVESALAGGLVLIGCDGACRDLASVHGTYRKVTETTPAIDLMIVHAASLGVSAVDFFLDRPVSNSGRLKAAIADRIEHHGLLSPSWNIELVDDPDRVLAEYAGVVATSDSALIDKCNAWIDFAELIIRRDAPAAWVVDLRSSGRSI